MTATSMGASADDHPDLPARIDAATAMRRLSHAIVSHRVDISDLHRIAAAAEELSSQIEAQPARGRLDEMMASPRFGAALESGSLGQAVEDGAFVDLFHDSPVSGSANPLGMGLRISRDGEEAVGTINLGAGWEGAPGRGHGGIVAACVDETIGGLLPIIGTMAFTGELTLRYRAPCPLATPLEFRASLRRRDGRKLYIECVGTSPEGLFVEATALFIAVQLDQLAGLIAQAPTGKDTQQ
jgi:hypothetical protein